MEHSISGIWATLLESLPKSDAKTLTINHGPTGARCIEKTFVCDETLVSGILTGVLKIFQGDLPSKVIERF